MTLRLYLRPIGLRAFSSADKSAKGHHGPAESLKGEGALLLPPRAQTLALAGSRAGFHEAELIIRTPDDTITRRIATVPELLAWARSHSPATIERLESLVERLTRPRPPLVGLDLTRPRLMAVLNVTPDSFSDGGDCFAPEHAIARGVAFLKAEADLIDVGGESTRPGAAPVPASEEADRVVPVITALAARGARLSIDSRHASVMRQALAAGAVLINDVSGLTDDPESMAVARDSGAPVVLMHMRGKPATMQTAPSYTDAALDVFDWLEARVNTCLAAGLPCHRLAVDPGIGFGKTLDHNLEILRQLSLFHGLGLPLVLGVSRKRFIAALSRDEPPRNRLAGTLTASLAALDQGCQLIRIHDLAEAAQARAVWEALHPLS